MAYELVVVGVSAGLAVAFFLSRLRRGISPAS